MSKDRYILFFGNSGQFFCFDISGNTKIKMALGAAKRAGGESSERVETVGTGISSRDEAIQKINLPDPRTGKITGVFMTNEKEG